MDDIWIISWFNHTAFDANPIWKSPDKLIGFRWDSGCLFGSAPKVQVMVVHAALAASYGEPELTIQMHERMNCKLPGNGHQPLHIDVAHKQLCGPWQP